MALILVVPPASATIFRPRSVSTSGASARRTIRCARAGLPRRRTGRGFQRSRRRALTLSISSSPTMPPEARKACKFDFADARHEKRGRSCQCQDFRHAELRQKHVLVFDRIGEERHRHEVGLSAGALGEPVDDVEGIGGKSAGQAAEEGYEADVGCRPSGEEIDRRRERAPMPTAMTLCSRWSRMLRR